MSDQNNEGLPKIAQNKKLMNIALTVLFVLAGGLAVWTFIGSPGSPPPVTSTTMNIQAGKEEVPTDPKEAAALKNPYEEDAAFIAEGKKIYQKNCSECHGAKGTLPAANAFVNKAAQSADGEYVRIVTYGVPGTPMTGKKDTLSLKERWQVVRYIRTEFVAPNQD